MKSSTLITDYTGSRRVCVVLTKVTSLAHSFTRTFKLWSMMSDRLGVTKTAATRQETRRGGAEASLLIDKATFLSQMATVDGYLERQRIRELMAW